MVLLSHFPSANTEAGDPAGRIYSGTGYLALDNPSITAKRIRHMELQVLGFAAATGPMTHVTEAQLTPLQIRSIRWVQSPVTPWMSQ